jgi:hypothetical protein
MSFPISEQPNLSISGFCGRDIGLETRINLQLNQGERYIELNIHDARLLVTELNNFINKYFGECNEN